jgi:ankyrin repeat protein
VDANGNSLVFIAAGCGRVAVVEYAMSLGVDWKPANNDGVTPLHYAASMGHLDTVQFLVDLGADWNQPDNNGNTPLHAIAMNSEELVNQETRLLAVLLYLMEECGADLRAANNEGKLPIDLAANEEVRQAIVDEEARRCNHTYKRPRLEDLQPAAALAAGAGAGADAAAAVQEEEDESEDDSEDEDEEVDD